MSLHINMRSAINTDSTGCKRRARAFGIQPDPLFARPLEGPRTGGLLLNDLKLQFFAVLSGEISLQKLLVGRSIRRHPHKIDLQGRE